MKSISNPEVSIRMAVLDIMDVTGMDEVDVLRSLSDRLEQNYANSRMYLRHGEHYRLNFNIATPFLWCLIDGEFEWSHPIDEVIDDYNRRVQVAIPFEQFNFRLPDLRRLLDREGLLDFEKDGLLDKWRYGRPWGEGNTPVATESKRKRQIKEIVSVAKKLNFEPKAILDNGKAAIKNECLKNKSLFTPSGFDHAWKAAKKPPYECIQIKDVEKYLPR